MPIITLTTDFGLKDHYVSAVKGAILKSCPGATIVDITHEVAVFNYIEAAFILRNVFREFPEKTIHIIGVNSVKETNEKYVAVEAEGQFFIGTDNGIFSLILDTIPGKIVELIDNENTTFPLKNIFVNAACKLANEIKIEDLGNRLDQLEVRMERQAYSNPDSIMGQVVYIDRYENAITNISQEHFEATAKGRSFNIMLKPSRSYANAYKEVGSSFSYSITKISSTYSDVVEGEKLALFNSSGYLEIAVNRGNAGKLLGLKPGEAIQVFF